MKCPIFRRKDMVPGELFQCIIISTRSRAHDQGQEIKELWPAKKVERPESSGFYYPFFSFPGIGAQPEDICSHVIPGVSRCFSFRYFVSINIDWYRLFICNRFSFVIGICIGITLKIIITKARRQTGTGKENPPA